MKGDLSGFAAMRNIMCIILFFWDGGTGSGMGWFWRILSTNDARYTVLGNEWSCL